MDYYFNQRNLNTRKSDDDINTLESLINDSSIKDKDFDDVLFASGQLKYWKNFDENKAWANLEGSILGRNKISLLKYVSAAVLLIGMTITFYVFSGGQETSFIAGEQNKYIVLPDGSDVVLSPYSELVISPGFNDSNRDISLKGDGYFNVVKNRELPFRVDVEKGNIEVLGTTFYIKQDEENLDVKLVSGVLRVANKKSESKVINDNQEARVGEEIEVESDKSFEEIDLLFDDLVLKDISLGEALQKINDVYDKEIIKIGKDSDSLGKEMIYMTVKNSSAVNFLHGLKIIFNIDITNVDGYYVISKQGNK